MSSSLDKILNDLQDNKEYQAEIREQIRETKITPETWALFRNQEYELNANKDIKLCTFNVRKWLIESGSLNNVYFDEFAGRYMSRSDDGKERPLSDRDIDMLVDKACLNEFKSSRISNKDIAAAMSVCPAVNPVKELIQSLKWDGIQRAETLLIDLFGVDDNSYTRAVVPLFLLGIIKRVYEPGTQYDYMLVLQGKQGYGKTSFFRAMSINEQWYAEIGAADMADKKLLGEKAQGKLILEYGELDGIRKAAADRLKAIISGREDNYRAAYAHFAESRRRKYVLAGTINEGAYLTDPTGNRRYLPIKIRQPGFLDRETVLQLYAEMYQVYLSGNYQLYLSKEVDDIAEQYRNNVTTLVSDDFIDNISYHLETYIGKSTHVTPWNVWHNLSGNDGCFYGISYKDARPAICQSLERLGWKFKAAKEPKCKTVVRAYWRPTEDQEQQEIDETL